MSDNTPTLPSIEAIQEALIDVFKGQGEPGLFRAMAAATVASYEVNHLGLSPEQAQDNLKQALGDSMEVVADNLPQRPMQDHEVSGAYRDVSDHPAANPMIGRKVKSILLSDDVLVVVAEGDDDMGLAIRGDRLQYATVTRRPEPAHLN